MTASSAADAPPPDNPSALAARLRDALSHDYPADAPGMAVGIVRGGEAFAFGLGQARLGTLGTGFTPATHFRACSLTKQFVALILLQLEAEGRLRLTDPPGRHVPALAGFDPSLTLIELAQNRSGLVDYWCAAMLTGARPETPFSLADGERLIGSLPRQMFPPGSGTRYNNGNWRILQWVVEAVSGQPLAALLHRRVFAPLHMQNSRLGEDTSASLPDGTLGYRRVEGRWEPEITRIEWSGDAALVTTLDDLLKWETACLTQDPRLPEVGRLADSRPHATAGIGQAAYAFGLNAWTHAGRRMHWHSGALRGFRMIHLRFPDEAASVVVMQNRTADPMPVALRVAALLGLAPAWATPQPADASVIGLPDPTGFHASDQVDLVAAFSEADGHCHLNFGMGRQKLVRADIDLLVTEDGLTEVRQRDSDLLITSRVMGFSAAFRRLKAPRTDSLPAGRYRCHELGSELELAADLHSLSLRGPKGESEVYPLQPLGEDWWAWDCARALDEAPPGRFHLRIASPGALRVSCLLAQGFVFKAC